jgi:hypothetical protein
VLSDFVVVVFFPLMIISCYPVFDYDSLQSFIYWSKDVIVFKLLKTYFLTKKKENQTDKCFFLKSKKNNLVL